MVAMVGQPDLVTYWFAAIKAMSVHIHKPVSVHMSRWLTDAENTLT